MTPGLGKLRSVQVLRGVAVLLVVIAHFSTPSGAEARYIPGPRLTSWLLLPMLPAVDLFFVISGLIICVTTMRRFGTPGAPGLFAYRRLTRVYPLYWIVTALVLIVFLIRPDLVNSHSGARPEVLQSFLLLPQAGEPLVLVGWTLTYELYFYVVFFVAMRFHRRWLPWIIGGWAALTVVLSLTIESSSPWVAVVANPVTLEFAFGVAVGVVLMRGVVVAPRALFSFALAVLAVTIIALGLSGRVQWPSLWFEAFVIGVPVAVLVYATVGLELRGHFRAPALLERAGDGSYSIYLWHVPILAAVGLALRPLLSDRLPVHILALLLEFAIVVAASLVLYVVIERPLLRAFHTRSFSVRLSRRVSATSAAGD
jgi:peptidoglycan/LPS O-acetylase OafA/YrhL